MDFTSIEFYTIAFVVAMTLVGFFLRQKRINPATSHIDTFVLEPQPGGDDDAANISAVRFTSGSNGIINVERTGLRLVEGETVNLIATIIDDKVTIEEKKGKVSALGGAESFYTGRVTLNYIPVDAKVYVRYESSVTGQWAKFSYKNREGIKAVHEFHY